MTEAQFISRINKRVSGDCGFPVTLTSDSIKSIIEEAIRYFGERYNDALETRYVAISSEMLTTKLFTSRRQIELPACIRAVTELYESGNHFLSGQMYNSPDFRKVGSMLLGSSSNRSLGSGVQGLDMVYYLTQQYEADFINTNFRLESIQFGYNFFNKKLTVLGRDPQRSLVARVEALIDNEYLFESSTFYNYALGMIYQQIDIILSIVDINLIGGNKINTSKLERISDKLITEAKKDIEESNEGADFFEIF